MHSEKTFTVHFYCSPKDLRQHTPNLETFADPDRCNYAEISDMSRILMLMPQLHQVTHHDNVRKCLSEICGVNVG